MFGNIACPKLNCRNIFHPTPSKHLAAREKKNFLNAEKNVYLVKVSLKITVMNDPKCVVNGEKIHFS